MAENRESFAFPSSVQAPDQGKRAAELARLLWRVVHLRPECVQGQVRMFRDSFLRDAGEVVLLPAEDLRPALQEFLLAHGRYLVPNFQVFVDGVLRLFLREVAYRSDRSRHFSPDILFQTIELISLNKTQAAAEGTIQELGRRDDISVSEQDRAQLLLHFRAYVDIQKRIKAMGGVRASLEQKDVLLIDAGRANPEVTVSALTDMLRTLVAQQLLAMKYSCDTLMVEWMREYGFGPLHMLKLSRLIPFETALAGFRSAYAAAVRSLREAAQDGDRIDSDMFLLRSLSNFYTSWTTKVAALVPA